MTDELLKDDIVAQAFIQALQNLTTAWLSKLTPEAAAKVALAVDNNFGDILISTTLTPEIKIHGELIMRDGELPPVTLFTVSFRSDTALN